MINEDVRIRDPRHSWRGGAGSPRFPACSAYVNLRLCAHGRIWDNSRRGGFTATWGIRVVPSLEAC